MEEKWLIKKKKKEYFLLKILDECRKNKLYHMF